MLTRLTARQLLSECTGRDIWSVDFCRQQHVPDAWVSELCDCFESGFMTDTARIYYQNRPVHQFHGVRDLDLARRLAQFLGVDAQAVCQLAWSPEAQVRALQEAVDE